MNTPFDSTKLIAKQLAEKVYSGEARDVIRLMQHSGLFVSHSELPSNFNSAKANTVGVWTRKTDSHGNASFVRDQVMAAEWGMWAQNVKISAKGNRKRVVYLGESAARGFLYDPGYTPAQVLESLLQSSFGVDAVDVVDLARTNADIHLIRKTASEALMLEPDALVIFAGNNWGPNAGYSSNSELCQKLAHALREGAITGFRNYIEESLGEEINNLSDDIAKLYGDIPVYWIVPEFCLGDWKDPDTNAPWLNDFNNIAWIETAEKARASLASLDYDSALKAAEQMLALDEGNCATTHYILGRIYRAIGDSNKEKLALENARNASLWDMLRQNSPRIMSLSQRMLRKKAIENNHHIIDMPELFQTHTSGQLPGRQLFLDYCHLNSDGIRLLMSATAAALITVLSNSKKIVSQDELFKVASNPSATAEAEAYLLAAIHNAHWGQCRELVLFYCKKALFFSPNIAKVMINYIEIQNNLAPIWMQKATESLLSNISPVLQRYFFQMEFKSLDEVLFDAFSQSLEMIAPETGQLLNQFRIKHHSIVGKETNLLDPFYHNTSISNEQTSQNSILHFNDYYEAFELKSEFRFVGESGKAAKNKVTLRLPQSDLLDSSGLVVSIFLNGKPIQEFRANRHWKTFEFDIAGDLVVDGINRVTIHWPIECAQREMAISDAADTVSSGRTPELFPVFGHIHTFIASNAEGYLDEDLLTALQDKSVVEDTTYDEEFI